MPGTNNFYTEDGYGGGPFINAGSTPPNANHGGGLTSTARTRLNMASERVASYLAGIKPSIKPNCEAGHYYLVNNYNPGYFGDGKNAYTDTNPKNTPFTIAPSNVRNIGIELSENNISWAYFGDQFNEYLADPYQVNFAPSGTGKDNYCNICNWAQYNTSIMTNSTLRTQHLHDTTDLYAGIASGDLPAASWVKPSGLVDGHPASSKLDLFEGFVKKIVDGVTANPALAKNTAIFVTFDEGGGAYDSGYVQPLDFFGDGTRNPDDCRLTLQSGWTNQSLIYRPRLHLEVHRGELGCEPNHGPQPGQFSKPDLNRCRSLRADESARDRRPDGHVQLRRAASVSLTDIGATKGAYP